MDTELENRVAIVSGASGAIGRAVAQALAAEGAAVLTTFHDNRTAADQLVDDIRSAGGSVDTIHFDLEDPTSGRRVVREAAKLGPVAVVVANAVVWPSLDGDEIPSLAASLQANVTGSLALVHAALPAMREHGWGRVVLVSSDVVEQPMAGPVSYVASKGALEAAARVLAVREAGHGILTNVVRPGFTLTERARTHPALGDEVIRGETAATPTGRICTPEDVATAATYLASGANGHVNGEVLSVAGGRELSRG